MTQVSIAVDIDGVLCDQVKAMKKWIWNKYRYRLFKKDITYWNYRFLNTDFSLEIEEALQDPAFILKMPVYKGAIEAMNSLNQDYHIIITTTRPKKTEQDTLQWLKKYFKFHEMNQKDKLSNSVHVLIDDHIDDITKFVETNPHAILFDQPWNRNRVALRELTRNKRIICCQGWKQVVKVINNLFPHPSND